MNQHVARSRGKVARRVGSSLLFIAIVAGGVTAGTLMPMLYHKPATPSVAPTANESEISSMGVSGSQSGADAGASRGPQARESRPAASTAVGESDDTGQTQMARDPSPDPALGTDADGRGDVAVNLVSAEVDEAGAIVGSAIVPGVVEEDAACTIFVTMGDNRVESRGSAAAASTSMNCVEGMRVEGTYLEEGTWQVAISYDSPRRTGVSPSVSVEVR